MKRIAVFASGNGSNFSAIAQAVKRGAVKAELALLVCDQPAAYVLIRARNERVQTVLVCREDFADKNAFEAAIIGQLRRYKIDLIVLAGFMRLLSPAFVKKFPCRILNIHPSLLPAFKGTHGIQDAFAYGAKISGVTVHFVDEHLDHGPIILQEPVRIEAADTCASFEARIHAVEHVVYPKAIALVLEGKVRVKGRCVRPR